MNSHYEAWSYKKRKHKKVKHKGNLFRKNLQLKDTVNSRLKATKIIDQRKAFYRQRIPEPSCLRKETVDVDIILVGAQSAQNNSWTMLCPRQNCNLKFQTQEKLNIFV